MDKKIRVNMLSMADSVDGQGVGSAYLELMKLLKEDGFLLMELILKVNLKIIILKEREFGILLMEM